MSQPFTDAQLAAFLDGTLEDETLIDAIEAAINADAALAERVEALAGADEAAAAVRDAFAPVLTAPVPEHLTRIVAAPASAEVLDLAAVRAARTLPAPANDTGGTWRWPQFAAMAASLVIGVMIGGPLLTAGGVAFLSGTLDHYLRAYNVTNGEQLWQARLPAGGQATPMSYTGRDGRQYVVVAAGGHGSLGTKAGDSVIAYALPAVQQR